VQTLAGFGRYDFGVKPTHYTLEGFTGIDGFDGPGGLYAMEYFRPMAGKRDTLLMFGYPRVSRVRATATLTPLRTALSRPGTCIPLSRFTSWSMARTR
jgi:hypothetical protein